MDFLVVAGGARANQDGPDLGGSTVDEVATADGENPLATGAG